MNGPQAAFDLLNTLALAGPDFVGERRGGLVGRTVASLKNAS
jgi:hypothetical protein